MANSEMEARLPQDKREEAAEVLRLVSGMSGSEQRDLLAFMRGVAFGQCMRTGQG